MPLFDHHIFICTNERDSSAARPSCLPQGSKKLKSAFKDAIKDAGLKHKIRANESGCLDQCEHGPVVVIYPEAVWYGNVHVRDVDDIVQQHPSRAALSSAYAYPNPALTPKIARTARPRSRSSNLNGPFITRVLYSI